MRSARPARVSHWAMLAGILEVPLPVDDRRHSRGRFDGAIILGDWHVTDAVAPVVMVALFPFFEWIIHVFVLHWRPKHLGRLTIDPLLAREHRAHHMDPRNVPLIFIPWKALLWGLPLAVAIALLAFPRPGRYGLTCRVPVRAGHRVRVEPLPDSQ